MRRNLLVALVTALVFGGAAQAALPDLHEPWDAGVESPYDAAVVVGLERYAELPDVPFADRDAQAFWTLLRHTRGIPENRIEHIKQGDRDKLLGALERVTASTSEDSTVWFYFAGHGALGDDGRPRLLGGEAPASAEGFAEHAVTVTEVLQRATARGARAVLVLDCGFAGVGRAGDAVPTVEGAAVFPDPDPRVLVWTAAGADGSADLLYETRHGAFTYLATGALRGWADGALDGVRDGAVTGAEAQAYVDDLVQGAGGQPFRPELLGADLSWPIAAGTLAAPPRRDAVLQGLRRGRAEDDPPRSPEERAAAWAAHRDLETSLHGASAKLWYQASKDWRRTQDRTLEGEAQAIEALQAFLEKYEDASVTVGDVSRPVQVIEVAQARSMLQQYVPAAPAVVHDYRYLSVSAGGYHTCGLTEDGEAVCWGDDRKGQCQPAEGPFTQVSAGGYHACGLTPEGQAACWGRPESFAGTPSGPFLLVSAGGQFTCGLGLRDGVAQCWGDGAEGLPDPPRGAFQWLSAGLYHVCGLRPDGRIECWGKPADRPMGDGYVDLDAGSFLTCAVKASGVGYCFGQEQEALAAPSDATFTHISLGASHACGLLPDGELRCWGEDRRGQCDAPAGPWERVSAGIYHTCGVRPDGTLQCWGSNGYGQSTPPP